MLILGSGGTSLTAQVAVRESGGTPIVVSRKGENNYENISRHIDADIIVNTTPSGMYPNTEEAPLDLKQFSSCSAVLDVIYNPFYTRLLLQAKALGIPEIGGLHMLVAQAAKACEVFTGQTINDCKIDEIRNEIQTSLTNIVLIGMPGSGKSTVGKKLADSLNMHFVDTDKAIEAKTGMPIPVFFRTIRGSRVSKAGSRGSTNIRKRAATGYRHRRRNCQGHRKLRAVKTKRNHYFLRKGSSFAFNKRQTSF